MNNIFKLKMAELSDLDAWMEMIEIAKNNFPQNWKSILYFNI